MAHGGTSGLLSSEGCGVGRMEKGAEGVLRGAEKLASPLSLSSPEG